MGRPQGFLDVCPDAAVLVDETGEIQQANRQVEAELGYPPADIVGQPVESLLLEADRDGHADLREAWMADPEPRSMGRELDFEARAADGSAVPVEVSLSPVEDDGDRYAIATIVSIAERKEREQELEAARKRYRTLLHAAPDPIFVADAATGEIIEANAAAEELRGQPREEIVGLNQTDLHPQGDVEAYRALFRDDDAVGSRIRRLPDGSLVQAVSADGEETPVEISAERIDLDGRTVVYAIFRDVSERVERERELRRKNDRLDEFASVVAHDLRNPLEVAQMSTTLVGEECDSDHLETVREALERMETIVGKTLTLARDGESVAEPRRVEVAALVEECWEMVDPTAATLAVADEFALRADPDRLRNVFENLFRNALDHAGPEATVTVGRAGEAAFYVEDDGPGIPPADREAVFDPGHTSAAAGTGLGLTIVKRIAAAHGWDVSVTEGRAGGARFEFTGVDVAAD